jgi:hypothetical protein
LLFLSEIPYHVHVEQALKVSKQFDVDIIEIALVQGIGFDGTYFYPFREYGRKSTCDDGISCRLISTWKGISESTGSGVTLPFPLQDARIVV